jgi:hypothetical protein
MNEEQESPETQTDDAAILAEVEELVTPEAEKDRDKVKAALIAAKREARAANRKVKELEPVAARARELDERLGKAQPIIDAVITNPKLRAEALRVASGEGTRRSGDTSEQPSDDDEARGHAEDYGMFMADGQTPDVARARRALDRIAGISRRQSEDIVRPFAGLALNEKGNANLREAMAMTDANGVPYATRESLLEVAKQMPPHLLANQDVVNLLVKTAIGEDRMRGRSPKLPDEPLFLERQGGGFRSAEPAITPEDRRFLDKFGITDKDYAASSKRLETAMATRRSIPLE